MNTNKKQKNTAITYINNRANNPQYSKRFFLRLLSIPSSVILGIGIITLLGMVCLWAIRATITPANQTPAEIVILPSNSQSNFVIAVIVMAFVVISVAFWTILAHYTRTLVLWLNTKLIVNLPLLYLQISLVLLFWFPLIVVLALENNGYQLEIVVLGSIISAIAVLFFIIEDCLRNYRKIPY